MSATRETTSTSDRFADQLGRVDERKRDGCHEAAALGVDRHKAVGGEAQQHLAHVWRLTPKAAQSPASDRRVWGGRRTSTMSP